MSKEKNKPIGEVPCPMRGCDATAQVYRYREQSGDASRRRFAGRLFAHHDGGKHRCEDQEYLLENATIWGANDQPKSDAPDASATQEKPKNHASTQPQPATRPTPQKEAQPAKKGWGWFG